VGLHVIWTPEFFPPTYAVILLNFNRCHSMLQSMKTYVYERRRGLGKSAAVVGGVYLVGRYVTERLEEVRDKVVQDQIARDRCVSPNMKGIVLCTISVLQSTQKVPAEPAEHFVYNHGFNSDFG
jgi:hypothetical protein